METHLDISNPFKKFCLSTLCTYPEFRDRKKDAPLGRFFEGIFFKFPASPTDSDHLFPPSLKDECLASS